MRARRGMTLVEAMLAASIVAIVALSVLEGTIISTKIAHENSQLLAADDYAWDVAWKWFNKSYDDLPVNASGVSYIGNVASNECPMLCREMTGAAAQVKVKVTYCASVHRHGTVVPAKLIDVDVAWGPSGDRKSLNGSVESGTRSYSHAVSLFKCEVDRGE